MRLLAIETSCDETAVSILDCEGSLENPTFSVLAEVTVTQLKLHQEYGGVVPMLAKREHQKALMPILIEALTKAGIHATKEARLSDDQKMELASILVREPELLEEIVNALPDIEIPKIDAIAVTHGPGLEPALWVGVNFAKALAYIWKLPVIATNHMEGHIYAGLAAKTSAEYEVRSAKLKLPALALLVSGGHTELVLVKDWCDYEILGRTRDDAVGEAFDKVARLLGLPYPGGPAISNLALGTSHWVLPQPLPRPMLHSHDLDFSFSGIKTAVLYMTKQIGDLSEEQKIAIAREFQDAAIEVLLKKSKDALWSTEARTFIIGGGVSANKLLRQRAVELIAAEFRHVTLSIPPTHLSTDNATMIGVAGYLRIQKFGFSDARTIVADGNASLETRQ